MRLMYDSVDADAIPADAEVVGGYVDGRYAWSVADWNRFPSATKVRISAVGTNINAHVFDVEVGCIWPPAKVVPLVVAARKLGIDPTVYVNERNDWGPTRAAFDAAGVAQPHYLVANYDGVRDPQTGKWTASVPAGAIGKQFAHPPMIGIHVDLSYVADYWPGVDGTFGNPAKGPNQGGNIMAALTELEQRELLDKTRAIHAALWFTENAPTVTGGPGPETVHDIVQRVAGRQAAQIDADRLDDTALSNIEQLVNRINDRGESGGMTIEDRAQFVADLAAAIPGMSTQTLVNAFQQLGWTVSVRQISTGG